MKRIQHEGQVVANNFRPGAIAVGNGGDQSGNRRELATEHPVHEPHVHCIDRHYAPPTIVISAIA